MILGAAFLPAAAPAVDEPAVLARFEHAERVAASDLPLVLVKGARAERAVVRRQAVLSSSVRLTAPAGAAAPAPLTCRWSFRTTLVSQVCFSSMTGLFACTEAAGTELASRAEGELALDGAPPSPACDDDHPAVAKARREVTAALAASAEADFAADLETRIRPLFRAAGVREGAGPAPSAAPSRRR